MTVLSKEFKMIGLKRGTVKLVPHDPKWKKLFLIEKQLLEDTFGDIIIAIEHIGSTAIPHIAAKPIIDINVGVKSLEIAKEMKEKFEKISYVHRPFIPSNKNEKWEELYVKGPEKKRTHYAHVTVYSNDHWENDLLFRDYLNNNPTRAKKYADLKNELAKKYADNRAIYTQSKEEFIKETLKLAHKESQP